jgi:hypothetical protein
MGGHKNPEYDKILDAMASRSTDDPQFQADAVKALEISWRDQSEAIKAIVYVRRHHQSP